MGLEEWKSYNVVRLGARSLVRSLRPELTGEELELVLDRLFEICADKRETTELTECIYANLERAYREALEKLERS